MSFIPENTPFIALPTALKGKVTPYQLSVLWVLQSYYPNIWPSYTKIAEDSMMSRSKVIKTVEELVELNLLQKQFRVDEYGQKTNCYRVTIWSQLKALPVPNASIHAGSLVSTTPVSDKYPPSVSQLPPKSSTATLTKTKLTKTNNYKNKSFEPFWKTYLAIPKDMRSISQSKSDTYKQFMKLDAKTRDKLKDCLEADLRARTRSLKQDKFTPLFPDACRWIGKGQYEQYLLTQANKPTTFKKLKNTPF